MSDTNATAVPGRYDVVICGGGLAGLALARQLQREQPGVSVLVVEKLERPLPVAAFKVGESTVEASAHYLREVLGLGEHLATEQFKKCGLRYFFGDSFGPLAGRPEVGLSNFAWIDSYQLDRGLLETRLRESIDGEGRLLEGWSVAEIVLGPDGSDHQLTLAGPNGARVVVATRWLVDATGRRRMLQRHLGLPRNRAAEVPFHAAWFRVRGRLDVERLVPDDNTAWHARVHGDLRYFSTNHLMGRGYWVWIIPLASGYTSVGVVVHGGLHEFAAISTQARCAEWIARHEPVLSAALGAGDKADFLAFKDYSYSSPRVFSHERWTCVGEAGVFADPFYSPGMWQIALSNGVTVALIERERTGTLTAAEVEAINDVYVQVNDELTRSIQSTFEYADRPPVVAAKLLWDFVTGWAMTGSLVINGTLTDSERRGVGLHADRRFWHLSRVMRALMVQWGTHSTGRFGFEFIDYLTIPFVRQTYDRTLSPGKDAATLERDHAATMDLLEELAQALFLLALEDVMPEALAEMPTPLWLNAWALSLDRSTWQRRGLAKPLTRPRDLTPLRCQLDAVFTRTRGPAAA